MRGVQVTTFVAICYRNNREQILNRMIREGLSEKVTFNDPARQALLPCFSDVDTEAPRSHT